MRLDRQMDEFGAFPQRDGELDLPDDLALMGEQLADDAQRLAASYPPPTSPAREVAAVASASPRQRPLSMVVSIAGGVLALGLLVGLAIQSIQRPVQPDPAAGTTGETLAVNEAPVPIAESAPEPSARERVIPAVSSGSTPPLTPAVWERGVTGPEMEGLMDLQRIDDLAIDIESLEF